MKQFRRILMAAAALAVLALPGLAQDRAPVAMAQGHRGFPFLRCLRTADLTDSQKADIKAIVDAARPTLKKDHDTIVADRQKLRADIQSGADKCIVGQDALNVHADQQTLQADLKSVKDQILAKLTPDQQSKVEGCLAAPKEMGMGMGHMGRGRFN
jgi:Spy/CpxP family protein refolding chaperone